MIRELSIELSYPFCRRFNCSLQTCVFPDTWKLSNVTPIDTGGNRSSPKHYCPVSLLCNPENVFERVVFKHLQGVRLHDGPDLKLFILVGWDRNFRLLLGPPGLN